jgi:hypothetical protein
MEHQNRNAFILALGNYSTCLEPYLRAAQERYAASYFGVEDQKFDFKEYCVKERATLDQIKSKLINFDSSEE